MADDSEITESDIWASPNQDAPPRPKTPKSPKTPKTPKTPANQPEIQPETIDHETRLRRELESVRKVNEAIEGVIGTLERAGGNMDVCDTNVIREMNSS